MPTLLKDRAWVVNEQCADEDMIGARFWVENAREAITSESSIGITPMASNGIIRRIRTRIRAIAHSCDASRRRADEGRSADPTLRSRFAAESSPRSRTKSEGNVIEKAGEIHLIEMREQEEGREMYAGGPWDKGRRRGREHREAAVVSDMYEELPERKARMETMLTKFVEEKASATRATAKAKPTGEKLDRGCFRCGQSGHYVRNCTHAETRRCFVCRSVGHTSRNGPERDRRGEERHDGGREPARATGTTHTVSVLVVDADDEKQSLRVRRAVQ